MAQKAKKTKKVSKLPFWTWRKKMAALIAIIIILLGAIYYYAFAASAIQKADIVIRVWELQNGSKTRLKDVIVVVKAATPPGCPASSTGQSRTQNNPKGTLENGIAVYWGCDTGPSAVGKKYYIESAKLKGYEPAPRSAYLFNQGGSFRIKKSLSGKKRMVVQNLYMRKQTNNSGNIVLSNDINPKHQNYSGSQPDPAWISNYTDSYFLGSVYPGWSADLVKLRSPDLSRNPNGTETTNGYMFGKISRPDGTWGCGWLEPGTVEQSSRDAKTNECSNHPFLNYVAPSSTELNEVRKLFGKEFNCDGGQSYRCGSPIPVPASDIDPNCDHTFYKNYFSNNTFGGGSFRDPAGTIDLTKSNALFYRYTTLDDRAAAVANPDNPAEGVNGLGWGFIDRSCIKKAPRGYFDSSGRVVPL